VPGDTNSALGAAIAALKEGVPVAHLEAGARSYDPTLPEEINRKMIDHCSAIMFAPSVNCALNLRREGIQGALVKTVGDTMYDLVKRSMPIIRKRSPARMSLDSDRKLVTVTVHRQATVDDRRSLSRLFQILASLSRMEFMVPLHPRTKKRLKEFKLASKVESIPNVRLVPPLGYLDMLSLVYRSDVVFTDSGGLQKEAFWIGVPCITLRENTEWVETVKLGANVLTGLDEAKIRRALRFFFSRSNIRSVIASLPNPYGNGAAAVKVVRCLRSVPQR
jgi:UDP-N-acetylglucosamine 2-epimerase (non-hydrolysing)